MLGRAQRRNAPSKSAAAKRPSALQNLWRQAGWGLAAAAALSIAVLSGRDDAAMQKVAAFLSSLSLQPRQTDTHQFDAEAAARQLAQGVRSLTEDRDRLAAKLNAVEHYVRDTTGSIKQQIETAKAEAIKAAKQPPPWPEDAPPVPMTPADIAAMVKTVAPAPASAAAPASSGATDGSSSPAPTSAANQAAADTTASIGQAYGADIGTASSMKALHARWASLRAAHPHLFEGMQPLVSVKQNPRTGRTELHLIVGPYSNADGAVQFCDFVVPFHLTCQPAMFDGSRLALQ